MAYLKLGETKKRNSIWKFCILPEVVPRSSPLPLLPQSLRQSKHRMQQIMVMEDGIKEKFGKVEKLKEAINSLHIQFTWSPPLPHQQETTGYVWSERLLQRGSTSGAWGRWNLRIYLGRKLL